MIRVKTWFEQSVCWLLTRHRDWERDQHGTFCLHCGKPVQ